LYRLLQYTALITESSSSSWQRSVYQVEYTKALRSSPLRANRAENLTERSQVACQTKEHGQGSHRFFCLVGTHRALRHYTSISQGTINKGCFHFYSDIFRGGDILQSAGGPRLRWLHIGLGGCDPTELAEVCHRPPSYKYMNFHAARVLFWVTVPAAGL
jgi:hypothetical protein